MKKIVLLAVAGLATAANAQITMNLSGVNMTDAGRGLANAEAGDVIRISMSATHTGMSLGLVKFDLSFANGLAANLQLTETGDTNFSFNMDGIETGRHAHMANAVSDRPTAAGSGASLMTAFPDASGFVLSDAAGSGIDLATFPPTQNLLITPFPISSDEVFFIFDYVYQGGTTVEISAIARGSGRIYRTSADGSGLSQAVDAGSSVVITPAPASLALVGVGGLIAARRRRA